MHITASLFRFDYWLDSYARPSGCNSEQKAAQVLGYIQVSWDDASGAETQPTSTDKHWANLTESEKAAAVVLGYTGTIWDNDSGSEPQPASAIKHWDELTSCGEIETHSCKFCHCCGLVDANGYRSPFRCCSLAKLCHSIFTRHE